jgi:hypothetical protein
MRGNGAGVGDDPQRPAGFSRPGTRLGRSRPAVVGFDASTGPGTAVRTPLSAMASARVTGQQTDYPIPT